MMQIYVRCYKYLGATDDNWIISAIGSYLQKTSLGLVQCAMSNDIPWLSMLHGMGDQKIQHLVRGVSRAI